jgi:hypothetical protein
MEKGTGNWKEDSKNGKIPPSGFSNPLEVNNDKEDIDNRLYFMHSSAYPGGE